MQDSLPKQYAQTILKTNVGVCLIVEYSITQVMTPKISIDHFEDVDQSLDNYGLIRHFDTPGKFKTATKKTSLLLSTDL